VKPTSCNPSFLIAQNLYFSHRLAVLIQHLVASSHGTNAIMLFRRQTLRFQIYLPFLLLCFFWSTICVPLQQPVNSLDPTTALSELALLQRLWNTSYDTSYDDTEALHRRECDYDAATNQWNCDDNLPTMSQLIDRMRNKPGGLATPERHAVFYTNLRDPNMGRSESWLLTWLNAKGYQDKYYWWAEALSRDCELVQYC
jgi:hypothetical protein